MTSVKHKVMAQMVAWHHYNGINPSDYVTDQAWHTDFTNSINGTYFDNKQLRADLESASGGLTVTPDNASKINIDEKITTAYAMVTNQFKWGSLVSGVRIESTDYTSSGPEGEHSDTFTEVLPSVNLNVDLLMTLNSEPHFQRV